MNKPKISVIICSIDAGKFARVSECYERLLTNWPHEIIGIHDAKSLAEGYSRGILRSTGKILVFSHDDILILDADFAPKIARYLENFDVLGFAGASRVTRGSWCGAGHPYLHGVVAHALPKDRQITLNVFGTPTWPVVPGIKVIDGLCMISTREAAEQTGFDATTFDGFHLYDLDFSFSAHKAGFRVGVVCDIPIIHESAGQFDARHKHYADRFVAKHGASFDQGNFPGAMDENTSPNVPAKGAFLPDHHALLAAWKREILERTTLSIQRRTSKP